MGEKFFLRVTAPIVVSSMVLLLLACTAAWYVHDLQTENARVMTLNVTSVRAAEELEIAVREVRATMTNYIWTRDKRFVDEIPDLRISTERWLQEADRLATTPEEQDMIARVKAGYARFFHEFDQLQANPSESAKVVAWRQLIDDVLTKEILVPAHEYLEFNEKTMLRASRRSSLIADRMVVGLLVLGVSGAIAGVLAGFGIARVLRHSIVQLKVPIVDAAGKLAEVVGPIVVSGDAGIKELEAVLHDMSSRVGRVVQRLQESQRDVLRGEQLAAVGQLAAGVAHELRNPLMAMKILVQSAAEQGGGLNGRDLVVLEEEITRLEHSIQTLLDFARPAQLENKMFDLRVIVGSAVGLVEARAGLQAVRIETKVPASAIMMYGDQTQIRQVLLNLLLNALDSLQRHGHILVAAQVMADAAEIQVADSGCGLPESLGDRIFEPFTSTKETGTGLGLSICRRIVEAHKGRITAGVRPGGGSVLTVELPMS